MAVPRQSTIILGQLIIVPDQAGTLLQLSNQHDPDTTYTLDAPIFEVDGRERGAFRYTGTLGEQSLEYGGYEVVLQYVDDATPSLSLRLTLRGYPDSPMIRLRYQITADTPATLTKQAGNDYISYTTLRSAVLADADLTEVQLSHFDPVAHSYMPAVETTHSDDIYHGYTFAGPIAVWHTPGQTCLLAYEHGADHPRAFVDFHTADHSGERSLTLVARTGNYYDGQVLGPAAMWESIWFEIGLAPTPLCTFLQRYRTFILNEMSEQPETRQPYLFYNTWCYQERNRYFHNRPYLESMHYERIMAEIDIAHELGIEVFVIDTGWYAKTGDWEVDRTRFPDGLRDVRRKLDDYGMRLGLWFNPTVAALTSRVYQAHPEYEMTRGGKPTHRAPVWETEESAAMCLVSDYADTYVETLVRLHEELGISYIKWDGIHQDGCDAPLHHHGTVANNPAERAACYAFEMGRRLIHIVEAVSRRCPGMIFDFDITEGGRFVGLGFLSVGKYFLINNGPYFSDFDIPSTTRIEPNTINVFFHPGPARPRICRQNVKYDAIIPSILFLTHYLPDRPALSQHNSLGALMLGGNGLWGDLLTLDAEDRALLAGQLAWYKRVRDAVTQSYPRVRGFAGSSPEIHEKLDPVTSSGIIVFFTVTPGRFTHVTQPLTFGAVDRVEGADEWEQLPDGRIKITVQLARNDARMVYVTGDDSVGGKVRFSADRRRF